MAVLAVFTVPIYLRVCGGFAWCVCAGLCSMTAYVSLCVHMDRVHAPVCTCTVCALCFCVVSAGVRVLRVLFIALCVCAPRVANKEYVGRVLCI